ncbi:LysR family transcriptional regulator [uncultured Parasutterella sp.]|uniref:LysR family transcriptional regulator n=1 Tax=uncultured Parasutterella sp. TaxID=1263098 RepID=UPI002599F15F|nr:LysR family transcriptional regulator [uncultured Parasutterella sp.]
MNIRVLRYFLAAASLPNLTSAAEFLHTTQPNLSRQLAELEDELGQSLFDRSQRKLKLTPQGEFLFKCARSIVDLFDRTRDELVHFEGLSGKIMITAGETCAFKYIAMALKRLQQESPKVVFEVISGHEPLIAEHLTSGVSQFGLFIGKVNTSPYVTLELNVEDRWGVICRKDSVLAGRDKVGPMDLKNLQLLGSLQAFKREEFTGWLGYAPEQLQLRGYFNLPSSAVLMVREKLGTLLCLEHVGGYESFDDLQFLPLDPPLTAKITLAWSRDTNLNLVCQRFLQHIKDINDELALKSEITAP